MPSSAIQLPAPNFHPLSIVMVVSQSCYSSLTHDRYLKVVVTVGHMVRRTHSRSAIASTRSLRPTKFFRYNLCVVTTSPVICGCCWEGFSSYPIDSSSWSPRRMFRLLTCRRSSSRKYHNPSTVQKSFSALLGSSGTKHRCTCNRTRDVINDFANGVNDKPFQPNVEPT
jgi:hypothetical protein